MIEKNRENGKYHAICDCCYEMSDEYDTLPKCQHGIKEDGWKHHFSKSDGKLEHFCSDCRED